MHSWLFSDWRYRKQFAKQHELPQDLVTMSEEERKDIQDHIDGMDPGSWSHGFSIGWRCWSMYKTALEVPQPHMCMILELTIEVDSYGSISDAEKHVRKCLRRRKDFKWAVEPVLQHLRMYHATVREQLFYGPPGSSPVLLWIPLCQS